jgi:hypothetical protein
MYSTLEVQEIVRLVSVIEVEKVMHVLQLSFQVEQLQVHEIVRQVPGMIL